MTSHLINRTRGPSGSYYRSGYSNSSESSGSPGSFGPSGSHYQSGHMKTHRPNAPQNNTDRVFCKPVSSEHLSRAFFLADKNAQTHRSLERMRHRFPDQFENVSRLMTIFEMGPGQEQVFEEFKEFDHVLETLDSHRRCFKKIASLTHCLGSLEHRVIPFESIIDSIERLRQYCSDASALATTYVFNERECKIDPGDAEHVKLKRFCSVINTVYAFLPTFKQYASIYKEKQAINLALRKQQERSQKFLEEEKAKEQQKQQLRLQRNNQKVVGASARLEIKQPVPSDIPSIPIPLTSMSMDNSKQNSVQDPVQIHVLDQDDSDEDVQGPVYCDMLDESDQEEEIVMFESDQEDHDQGPIDD